MYGKNKMMGGASDSQSKEKLAMYVHEYLVHIGAPKTANSFLQEIRWDKGITVGESPGFLHSWWSVFWDLYSAAPERRDTHEHTNEAKAFHDYGFVNSSYPNGLPHEHCMPGRPMPNAPQFLHRVSQPTLQGPGASMIPSLTGGPPEPLGGAGAMRPRHSLPPSMMPGGQPMHPSMRFHQPPYGPPVGSMMPGHPHMPPRPRWIGPPGPVTSQQHGPPHGPQQSLPPCSNISGMPPQTSVAPSPGHPGTPGPHVSSPNTVNNSSNNNMNPDSQQTPTSHYTPQQQTPPTSVSAASGAMSDQQQQQQALFSTRGDFEGGTVMMNGGRSSGPMMPPPPPEYGIPQPNPSGGMSGYPGDVKMSPMHAVDMMGGAGGPPQSQPPQQMMISPADYVGPGGAGGVPFVGGQPQMPPPELLGSHQIGNGGNPGQPQPPHPQSQMMQQHQPPHGGTGPGQGPPPPPQYMSSAGGLCAGGPVQFPEYSFNPIS